MQIRGTVKTWNDDRGFGFIESVQGGQEVFVHIKAFAPGSRRPQIGQLVIYEVELGQSGKKRAKNVHHFESAQVSRSATSERSARSGWASYLAIPVFLIVYLAVALVWRVSGWVAVLYLASSVLCFVMYAFDKWAAVEGRWRVAESTLIFVGVLGGWPGAIAAQQLFRHKSNKVSFRHAFWGSVGINVIAFVAIHSPLVTSKFA
jgi:uncharacterized membrane protein YsdA (DUF1294 family)/cold shock CspA family protein